MCVVRGRAGRRHVGLLCAASEARLLLSPSPEPSARHVGAVVQAEMLPSETQSEFSASPGGRPGPCQQNATC